MARAVESTALLEEGLLDKSGATIQEMFAGVAPRYDLLNRLLSARRDVAWRREAAAALPLEAGASVLDLCSGTGDQALSLRQRGFDVVAADFCLPMLALAGKKFAPLDARRPAGLAGDALRLPFANRRFDGLTVSFGLRNMASLDAGLREIARVLAVGGRVAFLEFAVPTRPLLRLLYLFYFRRLLPAIGRLVSPRGSAYGYLPASVLGFPQRRELVERMAGAGLTDGAWRDLTAGIVCLYTATKDER